MGGIFFELTVILVIASLLAILFRYIKQPPILAYILTGIIIGPLGFLDITNAELFKSMAEIGVTLLLFVLGLELKFDDLKSVGKVAIITGLGQILITSSIGFGLAVLLGFSSLAALYITIALTFSSTIIIVKLLTDKRDLNSLYGKISVGILLIQDFFAIISLIVLSGIAQGGGSLSFTHIGLVLLKGFLLILVTLYLSKAVVPGIVTRIARSPELLFLFSMAWAFGISALVSSPLIGFSIEIGGFLAGISLANSIESFHISNRARSVRDFFITIFFVSLGMGMVFAGIDRIIIQALIISAFVLIGKPIIVMTILGLLGYRKRTAFLTGLTVAQISEFSLIIIFLGAGLGHLPQDVIALITVVGIVTFAASTYMIMNGNVLYRKLSPYLDIFQRGKTSEKRIDLGEIKDHIVIVGVNRAGESILAAALAKPHDEIIVVDFNPDVVKNLIERDIKAVFGDVSDEEVIEHARVADAKIIISTITDLEDNLNLIKGVKKTKSKASIVVLARDKQSSDLLYKEGADYVVVPQVTSGKHIARLLRQDKLEEIDEYVEQVEKRI